MTTHGHAHRRRPLRGAVRRLADAAFIAQAGAAGLELRDVHAVRCYELLRDFESRFRLSIGSVLYIGANDGQDVPLLLRSYPNATVHCFEPQAACLQHLDGLSRRHPGRVQVHPLALSTEEGTALLRRPADHDQASSLLEPNDEMPARFAHVTGWGEESVATTTLDSWALTHWLEDDIMIKIDVQGAEQLVIEGGIATFQRARLVICELAVVPTYQAAPDMRVMFDEFTSLGFGYAGEVAQVRDGAGVVVEFDGAFVRPHLPA